MLRGESLRDAPRTTRDENAAPIFVATARRLVVEREAARKEGAGLVAAARAEAAHILARAEQDARRVQEDARLAGAEVGKLEALGIVAAAHAEEGALVDRSLDLIVSAARVVAERAVSEALATDDGALLAWTRAALVPLRGSRRVVVRGAAAAIERLRNRLAELIESSSNRMQVELVVDETLAEGRVVARSELGEIRIELSTQVAALAEVLRGALDPEVRKRRV